MDVGAYGTLAFWIALGRMAFFASIGITGRMPVPHMAGVVAGMGYFVADEETLDRDGLAALQQRKLATMLDEVLATNPFYQQKYRGVTFDALSDPLESLPFTTRDEVQRDQASSPPYGTNLTYPRERYLRIHQTSGTTSVNSGEVAAPLRWLDTAESWAWFRKCWGVIYAAGGIEKTDRIFFPFSFGPFIGFWAGFEAALEQGCFVLPAGGMSTSARSHHMLVNEATVLNCTPTYALRMAEVATSEGIDLARCGVRTVLVAGEPGGSIPATRERIATAWGARVLDHTGMTEIGSCSFECLEAPGGVHVIESEFIPEVVDPDSGEAVADGELGELVLTNLGRWGSPLIRYRTGDQVRMTRERCGCGRWFARLDGGILGRTDDMLVIRGNNVFPSTIEGLVREFAEVAEFAIEVDRGAALAELVIKLELVASDDAGVVARRVVTRFRDRLGFSPKVEIVEAGALPRFEMKARRVTMRGSS